MPYIWRCQISYNGSGTFLINSAGQPVVPGTTITTTAFNALTADLATGLTTAMTKDGQTTPTANIPMGGFKLTGLGAGTSATDAAQLGQLQNALVLTLITVSGADTITGTLVQTLTAYTTGQQFSFVVAGTNTTAVTLNIDGLGAKAVTRTGAVALAAGALVSGQIAIVEYDGTRFQLINANAFTNLTVSGALTVGTTLAVTGVATLTAQPILSSLTASQAVFSDGSKGLVSNAITGTGSVVMSTNAVLVTPNIGTPSAGVATNLTGTAAGLTAGTASAVAVGGITGLGSGVGAALALNVGSVGAPVLFNGAGGTPSSMTATNLTGTASSLTAGTASAVAVGGITGLGASVATALAVNVGSAGAFVTFNGAGGTPSSMTATNLTGTASNLTAGNVTTNANLTGAIVTSSGNATTVNMAPITNSLSADVACNNTANYFTGPSVSQGTSGTWFVSGVVTVVCLGASNIYLKLWDGTTVIASSAHSVFGVANVAFSISGYLASPAGNLRISVRDPTRADTLIIFNASGNSKDSTITAIRIA